MLTLGSPKFRGWASKRGDGLFARWDVPVDGHQILNVDYLTWNFS